MATAAGDGGTSSPCRLRLGPRPSSPSSDPPVRRSPRSDPPAGRSPRPESPPPPARRSPSADPAPPQVVAAPHAVAVFDQPPSHIEMIKQYLRPFATDGIRPPFINIAEVYADGVGPEQLSAAYDPALASDGSNTWMFFTHVVPHPGGRYKRQIPGIGTWQGERGNIRVTDQVTGVLLGHRRTLSFVATGSKTRFGWIMEEYSLHPAADDENLALSRVYRSPRTAARRHPRPRPPPGTLSSSASSSSSDPPPPKQSKQSKGKRSRASMGSDPANRARPKRCAAPNSDFSISSCVLEMNKLAMPDEEKAAAFEVLKDPVNREIFLSSMEVNQKAAAIWLRKALAKMVACEGRPFPRYGASSVGREDYGPDEHVEKHHSRPNMHKRSPDNNDDAQESLTIAIADEYIGAVIGREDYGPDEHVEKHHSRLNTSKRSEDNNDDAQESLTIAIAEEYVSAVIGRAGINIKHIMEATGAWIRISAEGDFVAGTTDREILIRGTQEAVGVASATIMDWVSAARRRKGGSEKPPVKPDTTPQEVEQQ